MPSLVGSEMFIKERYSSGFFGRFFDIEEKKTGTVFVPICLIEII